MSNTSEKFLVGIFDDEDILLHGVEGIREKGVKIHEVYTPFPVHGLDEVLKTTHRGFPFRNVGYHSRIDHADMDAWIRLADDYRW